MYRGRGKSAWRAGAKAEPKGGFHFITVAQLCMAWWAYRERLIELRDLRAWLACHEIGHERFWLERGRTPSFSYDEVHKLTGGGGGPTSTAESIGRLKRVGLVTVFKPSKLELAVSPDQLRVELPGYWEMLGLIEQRNAKGRVTDRSGGSKVPVQRNVLKLLAGGAKAGVIAAAFGHMIRGLFYRERLCAPNGACKASWIAEVFGIDVRTVKRGRAHLVQELGLLIPQEGTPQRVKNSCGEWYRFNLDWERPGPEQPAAVDNSEAVATRLSPPHAESTPSLTPPKRNRDLPSEAKTQTPGSAQTPGVYSSNQRLPKPTLRRVIPPDLGDIVRLFVLFGEAKRRGLVTGELEVGNRDLREFVALAEHARTIGTRNPCGLFRWLVERFGKTFVLRGKTLTVHQLVTEGDEAAAHERIKRHLCADQFQREEKPKQRPRDLFKELSDDARFARAAQDLLRRRGFNAHPLVYIRRERPEWTRERWDAAVAEIESARVEQSRINARVGESVGDLAGAFAGGIS